MMSKIIGVKKFSKKDGSADYEVVVVPAPMSKREMDKGSFGTRFEEVFIPADLQNKLTPADVGKDIQFEYQISGRFANIVNFAVK